MPNRLALAPVKTAFGGTDGLVTRTSCRSTTGAAPTVASAFIILEPLFVDPMGREHPRQLGANTGENIPGPEADRGGGPRRGFTASSPTSTTPGAPPTRRSLAARRRRPRRCRAPPPAPLPKPMSAERIREVLDAYAARRAAFARRASTVLSSSSVSATCRPSSCRCAPTPRTDDWGGEDGRWRFVDEVVAAVRGAIGPELALSARISADEKVEGGLDIDDAIELGRRLRGFGSAMPSTLSPARPATAHPGITSTWRCPAESTKRWRRGIRQAVSMPVIVAGRLGDPDRIRTVLGDGMADVVALGRPLLADPDLPLKMLEGREDEIMVCGSCLQGCLAKVKAGGPVSCLINPELGREGAPVLLAAAVGEPLVVVGRWPGRSRGGVNRSPGRFSGHPFRTTSHARWAVRPRRSHGRQGGHGAAVPLARACR